MKGIRPFGEVAERPVLFYVLVGATGLEPATVESEGIGDRRFAESGKVDANTYANTSAKNPLEKLAEAWDALTPEVQAKIAELVEQATKKGQASET